MTQFDWEKKLLGARTIGKDTAKMYLRFDSMEHAQHASSEVSMVLSSCETDYVAFPEYAAADDGSTDVCKYYDGQVIFDVEFVGKISTLNPKDSHIELNQAIVSLGLGKPLVVQETDQTSTSLEFRVEFDKISDAQKALREMGQENPTISNVSHLLLSSVCFDQY